MIEKLKEHMWNVLGLFGWGWMMYHCILIVRFGKIQIYEDNLWILYGEMIMIALIIAYGIKRSVRDLR